MIEGIVQVNIPICVYIVTIYSNQISMNVIKEMVAVVTIATILKEALNVHVTMAMN